MAESFELALGILRLAHPEARIRGFFALRERFEIAAEFVFGLAVIAGQHMAIGRLVEIAGIVECCRLLLGVRRLVEPLVRAGKRGFKARRILVCRNGIAVFVKDDLAKRRRRRARIATGNGTRSQTCVGIGCRCLIGGCRRSRGSLIGGAWCFQLALLGGARLARLPVPGNETRYPPGTCGSAPASAEAGKLISSIRPLSGADLFLELPDASNLTRLDLEQRRVPRRLGFRRELRG